MGEEIHEHTEQTNEINPFIKYELSFKSMQKKSVQMTNIHSSTIPEGLQLTMIFGFYRSQNKCYNMPLYRFVNYYSQKEQLQLDNLS